MQTVQGLPTVPLGQTSVISMGELYKIRTQLASAEATAQGTRILDQETMDKEDRRARSKDRVKTWTNTLEAYRMKKEAKRKERLDAEEARRQVQDKEEAQFQAQQRRGAIERAQKLLFEENDRVKTFNQVLSLSDALKEREFQIEISREKERRRKREDEYWHQKTMAQIKEQEEIEQKKLDEARARAQLAKQIQTEQLKDAETRIIQHKLDERHEGELIRARAVANAEEEERQKLDARLRARQKAIVSITETRRIAQEKAIADAKKEKEEAAVIAKFAEEKDRKQRQREARVAEITAKKHATRQRMIDRQTEYLLSIQTNEEQRLNDQVEKAEAARAAAEAAKEAKRKQMMAESYTFNVAQMRKKEAAKVVAKEEGRREAENLSQVFEEMKAAERAELEAEREKALRVKEGNRKQILMKQRRKEQEARAEAAEVEQMEQQFAEDDARFMEYCRNTVEEYREEGKTVKPLLLQIQKTLKPPMVSA